VTDPARSWPVEEETPLFFAVIEPKEISVPEHAQEADVDPQEPGTITGHQKQPQQKVDAVNTTKGIENDLGRWLKQLQADVEDVDGRWVLIARTHFQQGFMALNRAVFQPESEL
jgi:hypothetical protein